MLFFEALNAVCSEVYLLTDYFILIQAFLIYVPSSSDHYQSVKIEGLTKQRFAILV